MFAAALKTTPFRGAEEDDVEWWTDKGFVGTTDWLLLYEEKHGSPYILLRKVSAVMGTLLIPLTYITTRALGVGPLCSFLAAFYVLTDVLITLQSRLILCDVFLYFFNMASFAACFASLMPGRSKKSQLLWAAATGTLMGLAISVKLTAIGTVGLIGVHQLVALLLFQEGKKPEPFAAKFKFGLQKAALMLACATFVFFGLWTIHDVIMPYSGQGDGFMSPEFARTLAAKPAFGAAGRAAAAAALANPDMCPNHGNNWSDCGFAAINEAQCLARNCCWDPTSKRAWCYHKGTLTRPTLSYYARMKDTLRATWANNHGSAVAIHPAMSEWAEWPFMTGRSVPFSTIPGGTHEARGELKAMGNPGVYWPVAVFALLSTLIGGFVGVRACLNAAREASHDAPVPRKGVKSAPAPPPPAATGPAGPDADIHSTSRTLTAFGVLTFGYLANLVPYQLIERSKFSYHYTPALMVGVLLVAFVCDWAGRAASGRVKTVVHAGVLALLLTAAAGHAYWGAYA